MLTRNISRNLTRVCRYSIARSFSTTLYSKVAANAPGNVTEFAPKGRDTTTENNKLTETNKLEKTLQRFWEKVDIKQANDHLEVQLDGKPLRTPLGNALRVPPSKKQLAHLLAHEWSNLPNLKIRSHSLPLTSITSRAIDLIHSQTSTDPEVVAKIGKIDDIKIDLLRYLDTDTLLVFSPQLEYEGALREAQESIYRPLIANMEEFFTKVSGSSDNLKFSYLDSDLHGLRGNFQPQEVKDAALAWMNKISIWDLVALEKATLSAKSFLTGVAIVRANSSNPSIPDGGKHYTLEEVTKAATLEIIYQTERWGEVEDTHDVDKVDIRRNLASAAILAYTSS